ncbi:uncharacterized protein PV07_05204 [Cladophialophora immunda]|uniref:AB hydrolase-1 domain-containing protein n=1 Tax=Cladophialophora immunda TaxID=569365 RepID=A0A0D1ZN58_9EURO|nr:uncharacterized protein PV07_05204 [Cladophialophora immunda]KIW29386.1 hypothetical protein PV07_05204 [Cladophialophora immunda]OQV10560.1 hypothetical protein CLAIMM_14541 [Cladophialophora immunda]
MATQFAVLKLDVTKAAGLNEKAHVAATVHLPPPEKLVPVPIVCFAKPGGGYNRSYFTTDLPGPAAGIGSEAEWHAERGWIFVSLDHLGVGESSWHDAGKLDYVVMAAASHDAERQILRRLAEGTILPNYAKIQHAVKIGIGQSLGGCLTIVQQGRYHCYDGIGVLGYSAVHNHPPVKPGERPIVYRWLSRDGSPSHPSPILNEQQFQEYTKIPRNPAAGSPMAWVFHYDDVDPALAAADLARFNRRRPTDSIIRAEKGDPPWASLTIPIPAASTSTTPGTVASEAAAVLCPVLVAMGERDVVPDPRGEPRAYISSFSVDLFICSRMGHMHNFAGTRELLWRRLDIWSCWLREIKASTVVRHGPSNV